MKTLQAIRTKHEFQELFEQGRVLKGRFLKLWVLNEDAKSAGAGTMKLAIIVSRKTAPRATERNTWRRRIREIFRKKLSARLKGAAVLVQVRRTGPAAASDEIEKELEALFDPSRPKERAGSRRPAQDT